MKEMECSGVVLGWLDGILVYQRKGINRIILSLDCGLLSLFFFYVEKRVEEVDFVGARTCRVGSCKGIFGERGKRWMVVMYGIRSAFRWRGGRDAQLSELRVRFQMEGIKDNHG